MEQSLDRKRREGESYEAWRERFVAERDRPLECGCAPKGSHSRTRCEEAKRLQREVLRLSDQEELMRVKYGPAATETHEVASDRRLAYDLYRVHVGHRAMYPETEEIVKREGREKREGEVA